MSKILLVDDSETLRTQLGSLLRTNGYEVVESADGVQGLEAVKSNRDINLIICDVNMPNMDGITMCSHLADDTEANSIPIFMLTTETSVELKQKGKAAGVKGWITKPYNEDKLLTVLGQVLK